MATPEETHRLLREVERATEDAEVKRLEAADLVLRGKQARKEAVRAAMDAGINRDEIAKAAGVHRNLLYRILGKTDR